MSKFASFAVTAAAIIPKAVAFLSFVGVCLFHNQLLAAVSKPALITVSTKSFLLIGSAELRFVFK